MQFGKVYIDSSLDISEEEFYNIVRGKDIGSIDKKEAFIIFEKSKPKKNTKQKKEDEKLD
jgi:hypothetical protein